MTEATRPGASPEPTERPTGDDDGATMAKAYRPADVEPAVYARWLAADVFAPDGTGSRARTHDDPFVIIMPPPNVTGALHLGHAARTATEDLMVRRARMQGRPTLWLPGVDHASIAAQWVLRRVLADEGTTPEALGRERYLERMRRFMDETRPIILGQQQRLGASADWGRERFTMDERLGSRGAGRLQAALRGRPRVPRREARQLVPRLRDERVRPRGHRHARGGHPLARSDTTSSPRMARPTPPASRPSTARSSWRRPAPRRSSATPRWPSTPRTSATRRLVGRLVRIPFVERDVPIIADDDGRAGVRDRCGQGHAGPRPRPTSRPASATACP